jgi:flagellar basal-body rod protein FlgB
MIADLTWGVIGKDLDGLSKRLEATSQNVANMNTPGYSRKEVTFEDQLKEIVDSPRRLPLKRTNSRHMSNVRTDVAEVSPQDHTVDYEVYRGDGNNVDPETETARLTETRMLYQGMSRAMNKKIAAYRRVIGGGA